MNKENHLFVFQLSLLVNTSFLDLHSPLTLIKLSLLLNFLSYWVSVTKPVNGRYPEGRSSFSLLNLKLTFQVIFPLNFDTKTNIGRCWLKLSIFFQPSSTRSKQ